MNCVLCCGIFLRASKGFQFIPYSPLWRISNGVREPLGGVVAYPSLKICVFIMCMYSFMCLRRSEGAAFPGAGVTDGCKPPGMGAGNGIQVLARAESTPPPFFETGFVWVALPVLELTL